MLSLSKKKIRGKGRKQCDPRLILGGCRLVPSTPSSLHDISHHLQSLLLSKFTLINVYLFHSAHSLMLLSVLDIHITHHTIYMHYTSTFTFTHQCFITISISMYVVVQFVVSQLILLFMLFHHMAGLSLWFFGYH